MKRNRILLILMIASVFSLLAGCTGADSMATSWPGFLVDQATDTIYLSFNAHVYALNLSNGTEKWRFPSEADNKITFFADPVLTSERNLIVGSYNNILYSLEAESGNKVWEFTESKNRYVAGALIVEDQVFAPSSDNHLYCVTEAGTLRWKGSTDHSLWATPVSDGTYVFQPSMDHHLYQYQIESGELIWKSDDLGGTMIGQPLLSPDGILYLGTFGNEIIAIDINTHEILWRFSTNGWVWSGPYLEEDVLYFGDLEGFIYAVDSQSGNSIWQIQPDTSENRGIFGRVLAVDDTLYFASRGGILYAVDKVNGNPRWNKAFEAQFFSNLVQSEDTILLSANKSDAILYAVETNGNQRWSFIPAK
jgi:eukaryotic-like serine/threonine-protein kinase